MGCGISSTSLKGYHTAARGQSETTHAPVLVRAAPGLPCGRAGARSTRCHTAPACKIINDSVAPARSLVEKHLTQNQMLGSRQTADQRLQPKSFPLYISWYINGYGPPWTSSDGKPRIRPVHGQTAGPGGGCMRLRNRRLREAKLTPFGRIPVHGGRRMPAGAYPAGAVDIWMAVPKRSQRLSETGRAVDS